MDLIKNILTFDDSFENYNLHGGSGAQAANGAPANGAPAKASPA